MNTIYFVEFVIIFFLLKGENTLGHHRLIKTKRKEDFKLLNTLISVRVERKQVLVKREAKINFHEKDIDRSVKLPEQLSCF